MYWVIRNTEHVYACLLTNVIQKQGTFFLTDDQWYLMLKYRISKDDIWYSLNWLNKVQLINHLKGWFLCVLVVWEVPVRGHLCNYLARRFINHTLSPALSRCAQSGEFKHSPDSVITIYQRSQWYHPHRVKVPVFKFACMGKFLRSYRFVHILLLPVLLWL